MNELDWPSVVKDIGPRLYRYFSLTCERAVAEDLVQETLIRLLQKVRDGRFDSRRGNLRMYAFGIAHFVRIEARRTPSALHLIEDVTSDAHAPDLALAEQQTRRRLRMAIGQLNEAQQQVLSLYLDEELTLEQIGVILNLPAATVRSHLHRAKDQMKRILNEGADLERA